MAHPENCNESANGYERQKGCFIFEIHILLVWVSNSSFVPEGSLEIKLTYYKV
jgi:hypothetical protein